jgi:hypothetical protein
VVGAATIFSLGVLLAGCSGGTDEPLEQSVAMSYVEAGETVETTVAVPELECSELAGTLLYSLDGENKDTEWGTLTASATADVDSYSISIALGEGLWFISTNEFESTARSLTLSSLEGIVMPVTFDERTPDYGDAIDTAATATATLECTTVD